MSRTRPAGPIALAILAVASTPPPAADAQTAADLQIAPDSFEVAVTGGYHSLDLDGAGGRTHAIFVAAELGRFLGRSHEVGARLDFFAIGNASPGVTVAGVYSYNFNTGDYMVPFLAAGFGLGFDTVPLVGPVPAVVDDVSRQLSLSAGTKDMIGNSAAVRVEYRYDRILREAEDYDRHSVLFGISLLIGPEVRAARTPAGEPRESGVGY
jgi:hypothetical protein